MECGLQGPLQSLLVALVEVSAWLADRELPTTVIPFVPLSWLALLRGGAAVVVRAMFLLSSLGSKRSKHPEQAKGTSVGPQQEKPTMILPVWVRAASHPGSRACRQWERASAPPCLFWEAGPAPLIPGIFSSRRGVQMVHSPGDKCSTCGSMCTDSLGSFEEHWRWHTAGQVES